MNAMGRTTASSNRVEEGTSRRQEEDIEALRERVSSFCENKTQRNIFIIQERRKREADMDHVDLTSQMELMANFENF